MSPYAEDPAAQVRLRDGVLLYLRGFRRSVTAAAPGAAEKRAVGRPAARMLPGAGRVPERRGAAASVTGHGAGRAAYSA